MPLRTSGAGLETFRGEELIASGHHFFRHGFKGLAMTVQEAVRRWGEPNGYIVGQEASAAIFGGLRYGEGMLYTRNAGERRIYWQGPSLGFERGRPISCHQRRMVRPAKAAVHRQSRPKSCRADAR